MDITALIEELLDAQFRFDEWAEKVLEVGIDIWNFAVVAIVRLLGTDLDSFAGGAGLDFVMNLQPVFLSIAAPLFVCFFFYNIYEQSYEEKKSRLDIWNVIQMFYPLVIGEAILTYSTDIVVWVFKMGFYLVRSVTHYNIDSLLIDKDVVMQAMADNELTFGEDIVGGILQLLLSLFTVVILVVCALMLFYIVDFRYIKLYALLPFSSLAFCTYVGPQEFRRISVMYFKYITALALESVAMLVTIILCNVIVTGNIDSGIMDIVGLFHIDNHFGILLAHYLVLIFNCCMTVGAAKGSEQVIERWLVH